VPGARAACRLSAPRRFLRQPAAATDRHHGPPGRPVDHLPRHQMADVLMRTLLLALSLTCGCVPQLGFSFRQLAYPMETRYVDFDGIEVAYHDRGQGPRTL